MVGDERHEFQRLRAPLIMISRYEDEEHQHYSLPQTSPVQANAVKRMLLATENSGYRGSRAWMRSSKRCVPSRCTVYMHKENAMHLDGAAISAAHRLSLLAPATHSQRRWQCGRAKPKRMTCYGASEGRGATTKTPRRPTFSRLSLHSKF